jgi:hypothetical protein
LFVAAIAYCRRYCGIPYSLTSYRRGWFHDGNAG